MEVHSRRGVWRQAKGEPWPAVAALPRRWRAAKRSLSSQGTLKLCWGAVRGMPRLKYWVVSPV